MELAPWREPLARALHRNRSLAYCRYFQLATIRSDGHPANRTVVYRGFMDQTNQLKMITDSRSQKVQQITKNQSAEACWYFPKTREQFRLFGQLTLITATSSDRILSSERQQVWQDLSDNARSQFFWPSPGQSRVDASEFTPPEVFPVEPPAEFCLLLLEPEHIDHLELRGEPQNRYLYWREANNNWLTQAVNP
ncbi:Npun_F5749 family FMN-dependent PPOX-type flavoprotein [Lyngbya sp. PCC 8106]|uniref:Npun_F5749 family FMN-dependent PPOX-type flavoprotein n=1 Tax=Lyngbya sp. (strain PCC 8106) TaxID=313612 RepID=UPI0000EAA205|nr:Npun_F5749 family FMN-dependent PPOX-type flavoprotein [Lyngbya sp. PCC 8106]EAW36952.1 Pyridoxamine 5'-phosphate oxidase-related, FMN-binding [Lyngbya sp. PCC 8106]